MTQEDIIRMAREAGFFVWTDDQATIEGYGEDLERFAQLVAALAAAAEREACANVCDDIDTEYHGEDVPATWCARAIRARGQQ